MTIVAPRGRKAGGGETAFSSARSGRAGEWLVPASRSMGGTRGRVGGSLTLTGGRVIGLQPAAEAFSRSMKRLLQKSARTPGNRHFVRSAGNSENGEDGFAQSGASFRIGESHVLPLPTAWTYFMTKWLHTTCRVRLNGENH